MLLDCFVRLNIGTEIKMKSVNLVGHPYAPIGMGEHVRCTYRALRSIGMRPTISDIYKMNSPATYEAAEFVHTPFGASSGINIFHINGDEVEQAIAHLGGKDILKQGHNIIYPAWELSRYPIEWVKYLEYFHEVWAPSKFIQDSIEVAVTVPVVSMPLACEVSLTSFLSRRYFGLPKADYIFLFFFDIRSYVSRKNPSAVIDVFKQLLKDRPYSNVRLVLKVNGLEISPPVMQKLIEEMGESISRVTILYSVMSDNEVKNLIRCCDCFISLHRSEGFGRGMSEAMVLGKPVIATGYSGNMEFMNFDNSFPISFQLRPLKMGEYVYWENQFWAEPDLNEALKAMTKLCDDPEYGRLIGDRARLYMQKYFSFRSIGPNYQKRFREISGTLS